MHLRLIVAASILCALFARSARAEERGPPVKVETKKEWYGAPIIPIDVAAAAIFIAGLREEMRSDLSIRETSWPLQMGAALYTLGGPSVHIAQQAGARPLLSLLLRVGAPTVLGAPFFLMSARDCDGLFFSGICHTIGTFWRGLGWGFAIVGVLVASITDIGELAKRRVPLEPQRAWNVVPIVAIQPDRAAFGLGGVF